MAKNNVRFSFSITKRAKKSYWYDYSSRYAGHHSQSISMDSQKSFFKEDRRFLNIRSLKSMHTTLLSLKTSLNQNWNDIYGFQLEAYQWNSSE